jgi:hypothetical protein
MNDFSKIGYDYGIKPFFMIVGDMEFSDLFRKAECVGVLYMFAKDNNDNMIPMQMAFIFKNEEPAKKFLDIVLGWVEKSNNDGDAVEMEFIENNKGGYTIAVSPEIKRLTERMIPPNFKDKVTPILMAQTHFKEIDNLGQNYLDFKRNYKKTKGIAIGYIIGSPTKFVKKSEKYFVKTNFKFLKEDEIPKNSLSSSYKAARDISKFKPEDLSKPPKDSIEEICDRRISEMKSLLPLTYNRLENLWLGDLQEQLEKNYSSDVIKQAICNITIFERIQRDKNLEEDFTETEYPNRILDYLLSSYESFDSYYPDDEFYTEEKIISQIVNDKKELETYFKK